MLLRYSPTKNKFGIAGFGLQQVKADTFTSMRNAGNPAINGFTGPYGTSTPSGVFVAEDHALFREALKVLLNKEVDLRIVGEADNTRDAMRFLTTTQASVGIALVDITLKGRSGLELIKDMKAHRINIPALVLSMHDESLYAERSLRAGARGYIKKDTTFENLKSAIRTVLRGEIYLASTVASKILGGLSSSKEVKGIAQLTDRELEIFRLIGCGVTTGEIAAQLSLGITTIETYRARIKTKLRLENASSLSCEAVRWTLS
jgi:DNA-binding NarL/FixJ family response regulator